MEVKPFIFDKNRLSQQAVGFFIQSCGLDPFSEKFGRMMADAERVKEEIQEKIQINGAMAYFDQFKLQGDTLSLGETQFTCNAFSLMPPQSVKAVYAYVITAGDCSLDSKGVLDQLYGDMWGNAYLDVGRSTLKQDLFSDYLMKNKKDGQHQEVTITDSFGPGFYGMDVRDTGKIFGLFGFSELEDVGMTCREDGIMVPLKSCAGLYLIVNKSTELPDTTCQNCIGSKINCRLCRATRNLNTLHERKTKLFYMPADFVPDKGKKFGIGFDIGTTTVVGNLWDLENGKSIQIIGKTNPQKIFGTDVISRIHYCSDDPEKFIGLRGKIIDCLNEIIEEFILIHQLNREEIVKVTVAGNTTMSHIFAGFNPKPLAHFPFKTSYAGEMVFNAAAVQLNIKANATVILVPNIGGHIGGDITAGILATRLDEMEGMNLFIDIGTNGEIVLAKEEKLVACSTAAGPAFEGASIYQGMRGEAGAIEGVQIQEGRVTIKTIEECEPIGICGSGIIQAVAELIKAGVVNHTGRLLLPTEIGEPGFSEELKARIREGDKGREFVLAYKIGQEDIVLTQKDIREVQLAKGAVFAGIMLLIRNFGEKVENLNKIIIAGAFGSYIDKESSLTIGLFPRVPMDKIVFAGNAAGSGGSLVLLSEKERKKAIQIANKTGHLELADLEDFQEEFLKAMSF